MHVRHLLIPSILALASCLPGWAEDGKIIYPKEIENCEPCKRLWLVNNQKSSHSSKPDYVTGQVLLSLSLAQLETLMRGEEYAVTRTGDELTWVIDGCTCWISVAEGKRSIEFAVAFTQTSANLDKINAWNQRHPFSRSHLDGERDPHLTLDLDLEGGVTQDRVLGFFRTCQASLASWREQVLN